MFTMCSLKWIKKVKFDKIIKFDKNVKVEQNVKFEMASTSPTSSHCLLFLQRLNNMHELIRCEEDQILLHLFRRNYPDNIWWVSSEDSYSPYHPQP